MHVLRQAVLRFCGDGIRGRSVGLLSAVVCPRIHQHSALGQCVATTVCTFCRIAYRVGKRSLGDLARVVCLFGRPIAEGGTEAVYGDTSPATCLSIIAKAICDSPCPPFAPGKTKSFGEVCSGATEVRISIAGVDSGTRCSRPAFMRTAGTDHSAFPVSISLHLAPITSPVRAAVRIRNSNASADIACDCRRSARNCGTCS